ncbi:MAG: hypothetical protein JWQ14_3119 [Adhaeribacter sp.]|nr:hypothetical protein [Adhaeribacter sp.]
MKVSQLFISFGLVVAFNSFAANTWAYQTIVGKDKPGALKKESSKYKYHEASTLSGIMVQENKKTGTFLLKFDQLLNQTGFL